MNQQHHDKELEQNGQYKYRLWRHTHFQRQVRADDIQEIQDGEHDLIGLDLARGQHCRIERSGETIYEGINKDQVGKVHRMVRHLDEPHVKQGARVVDEREYQDDRQEERELGALDKQVVQAAHLIRGIGLGNMWLDRGHESADEAGHHAIDLHSHALGSIDYWAEEDVQQHHDTLVLEHHSGIADESPTHKHGDFLHYLSVEGRTRLALGELDRTVEEIDRLIYHTGDESQD